MISGHQSGQTPALTLDGAECLNPFDIRASVRTRPPGDPRGDLRLNPFDIRASVRTSMTPKCGASASSLNPFDIRASVRTSRKDRSQRRRRVSIPLISGHQSGQSPASRAPRMSSLNPFDIRASVRTPRKGGCLVWISLNPFDIRASVRTLPVVGHDHRSRVSIPLISGHQSGLCTPDLPRATMVSIPLISGHQSGPSVRGISGDAR